MSVLSLKRQIALAIIETSNGRSQQEIAILCKTSQPRIDSLLNMQINRFSIDSLVTIAERLGCKVDIQILQAEQPHSMKHAYMLPLPLLVIPSKIHDGCENEFRFA